MLSKNKKSYYFIHIINSELVIRDNEYYDRSTVVAAAPIFLSRGSAFDWMYKMSRA